jgi:uncharacterized pyridoxamine 5'-phosphate oxidase family protein
MSNFAVYLPYLALLVTIIVGFIGYMQLKIASSKIKLDLYNRRFKIYESVLSLYQEVHRWEEEKITLLEIDMIKSLRESKFLFGKQDKIYETILAIKDANGKNTAYHKQIKEWPQNQNAETSRLLHKLAVEGREDFENNLIILEDKLEKYLNFKTVNGWNIFR